jgi:hypothetical protein
MWHGDVHRLAAMNPVFLLWAAAAPDSAPPAGPAEQADPA